MKRKYVLLILTFLTALLCSVGSSIWIILEEKNVIPNYFDTYSTTITTAPTVGDFYYGEDITPTGGVATGEDGTTVTGTWSIDTKVTTSGSGSSIATKATVTFTPNSMSYLKSTTTINVTMLAVAKLNKGTDTFYTTLDSALASATSGTVYSIASGNYTTETTRSVEAKTISKKATINSGVSLILPYSGTTYSYREGTNSAFADTAESTYLKNYVTIADGVTITNNGTIIVGGILGTTAESGNQGHTSADYAQINMGAGAHIENNGTIDCYGFIKDNNDSTINNTKETSVIRAPFVIYDYRGPAHTVGSYKKGGISPFAIYDMPNIYSAITSCASSKIIGYVDLYTQGNVPLLGEQKQHNLEALTIFYKSDAVINLYEDSTATLDYITTASPNKSTIGKTNITLSGGAESGTLALKVKFAAIVNETIDMSSILFPVSWKLNLTLTNGSYALSSQYKFMPGSKLTVADSATANISTNIIFYDKNFKTNYPQQSTNATLQIDGTVNVTTTGALAGYIKPGSNGAILNVGTENLSITSKEGTGTFDTGSILSGGVDAAAGFNESGTVTKSVTADIVSNGTITEGANLSKAVYKSNGSAWALVQDPKFYTVNLNHNYTNSPNSSYSLLMEEGVNSVVITEIYASNPTRAHYTFDGWFLDADCKTPVSNNTTATAEGEELTVYAKWIEKTYTLQYMTVYDNQSTSTTDYQSVTFKYSDTLSISLPTTGINGYTLIGWFPDINDKTKRIPTLDAETFLQYVDSNDVITLYGSLTKSFTVTVVTNHNDVKINDLLIPEGDTVENLDSLINEKETSYSTSFDSYFLGWYTRSDFAEGSEFTSTTSVTSDMTIYGKWETKITLTVSISEKSGANDDDTKFAVNYTLKIKSADGDEYATISPGDITSATTHTYKIRKGDSIYVTVSPGEYSGTQNTWTKISADTTLTMNYDNSESCIVEGTLITLADGTQKRIEDVTPSDKLLIFNHETGKYEIGQVLFTSHNTEDAKLYRILNLQFSDGTVLRIVASHGLFDLDLNKYVYIKESNYNNYIGHRFYKSEFNGTEFIGGEITLTKVYITEEILKIFCPVTVFHMNCFAESLLTMPNIPYNEDGLVNFFEFSDGLKYDEEKMQADIEKYGLYTYEDFAEYFSYEAFLASPAKYLKISMGKGLITFDEILLIIDYLLNGSYIS